MEAYCEERYRERMLRQLSLFANKHGMQLVAAPRPVGKKHLVYQPLEGCLSKGLNRHLTRYG
jgi:hypothetical protein